MTLGNDDENKCFGVTLRTPPANSTGYSPHPSTPCCGLSRKYPIKEPFVELIKRVPEHLPQRHDLPRSHLLPRRVVQPPGLSQPRGRLPDAVFHPRCVNNEKTFQQGCTTSWTPRTRR